MAASSGLALCQIVVGSEEFGELVLEFLADEEVSSSKVQSSLI